MEELESFVSYNRDPLVDPSLGHVLRFWEDSDPNFEFDPKHVLPEAAEPVVTDPPIFPESGNEIASPSDPLNDPLLWDILNNPIIEGDQSINQEQESTEYLNTGYGSAIALSNWPPPLVPFSCSCCQVLREIIHVNGTHTTKLEIHGRVGIICHAIFENRNSTDGLPAIEHQMIDFCMQSMERVKQFLMHYCQERREAGFVTLQDPLSTFYEALCAGLNWDKNPNTVEFIQTIQTESGVCEVNHHEAESSVDRRPKSSLAAQRERTRRLKLYDLADHFHLPIEVAAKRLAICPTVLKKICRKYGIQRWPHRKIKSVDRKITNLQPSLRANDGAESARARAELEKLRQERAQACIGMID